MNVNFKFELNQVVVSPFGEKGIISMASFDASGNSYYVKQANGNSGWWQENQLSEANL